MVYGLSAFNNLGEVTVSSDAWTYGYIGKATLVSVTQPVISPTSAGGGYSTYTINWPRQIIVALPLAGNGGTTLLSQSRSGSTWTIHVHKATGDKVSYSGNVQDVDVQESTEVFVFGAPVAATGWGLALYNASGNPAADFGRRPLFVGAVVSFAADQFTKSFSGLTKPAVIVTDPMEGQTVAVAPGAFWHDRNLAGSWRWESGALERVLFCTDYTLDDSPYVNITIAPAVDAVLIEAAGLT